eukprot:gene931-263_t
MGDTEKQNNHSSSSEDEQEDENCVVTKALNRVLDDWFVTGFSRFAAKQFIKKKLEGDSCERVREWLLLRMNNKYWQHGFDRRSITGDNIPNLRSHPIWKNEHFSWIGDVQEQYANVLQEILALRKNASTFFRPYRDPVNDINTNEKQADDGVGVEATDRGQWNVLYFLLNHKRFEENCKACPVTVNLVENILPRQFSHAFVSALTPGSHIKAHCGPSNRMLRVWLPLCGMEGCKLRVGDEIVYPRAGEVLIWDHSFNHE